MTPLAWVVLALAAVVLVGLLLLTCEEHVDQHVDLALAGPPLLPARPDHAHDAVSRYRALITDDMIDPTRALIMAVMEYAGHDDATFVAVARAVLSVHVSGGTAPRGTS